MTATPEVTWRVECRDCTARDGYVRCRVYDDPERAVRDAGGHCKARTAKGGRK